MEFWGVEVKSGETFEVNLDDGMVLHLSQASLGEIKNNKNESVCLHINVKGKKLVLGTLHSTNLPQQLFDLVFEKTFTVSHNWKNGSVYFYGYKADQSGDNDLESSDDDDTDEEEEAIRLPIPNGKEEAAKVAVTKKEEKPVPAKKDVKQVKIVEPGKDDEDDSDDSSDDSDSSAMSEEDDSASDDDDSSDDEDDSSDEEEEETPTPKKPQSGKKRPAESSSKTPTTDKKAKMTTPQKTDGKKAVVHQATPHPSKKAEAKTAGNKSNQKSPASAADGAHSCKACNRNFKTDGALQSHNQAKHVSK